MDSPHSYFKRICLVITKVGRPATCAAWVGKPKVLTPGKHQAPRLCADAPCNWNGIVHNANNAPKFRYAGVIPVNQQYGLAFNDEQDELRVAMNKALATMKRNGQYQRLINRWGLQSLMP